MNLMIIGEDYKKAFEYLLNDDSIGDDSIENSLQSINASFEEKARNIALFSLKLEEDLIDMVSQQKYIISSMDNKVNALSSKITSIREYLLNNMKNINKTVIKSPVVDISIRKNSSKTIIEDESKIPAKYKKIVSSTSIDKNLIKSDIKDGRIVDGAYLMPSESLIIKSSI